jgi:mitochondrial import inner membrane translocase subunit TIM44
MRSVRPTLRIARSSLLQSRSHNIPPSLRLVPRPSIFPARPILPATNTTQRFYSTEPDPKEQPKEGGEQQQQKNNKKKGGKSEEEEDPKKHFREDTGPPPDPNKSPFQVFVDTFKSELSKSQELQESVKALQDESGKLGDSEALRRAKEAYAKARVITPQLNQPLS